MEASPSLERLLFRKERRLIEAMAIAIDPSIAIQDCQGMYLLGTASSQPSRSSLPIQVGEQILGWVQGEQGSQIMADYLVALAQRELEKRALAQELMGKYREIALLFNFSEKTVDFLDVRSMARFALQEVVQILASHHGAIWLRHEGSQTLEILDTFGEDGCFGKSVLVGQGILGKIVAKASGEIVDDVSSDPRYLADQDWQNTKSSASLIAVPLQLKDRSIGLIALGRLPMQPYHAEDLRLLTTLTSQISSMLGSLLHEQKLKESRQNDLIYRLSSQIRNSLDLGKILDTSVTEIYHALKLDTCFFLWLVNDDPAKKCLPLNDFMQEATHTEKNGIYIMSIMSVAPAAKLDRPSPQAGFYEFSQVGSVAQALLQGEVVCLDHHEGLADPISQQFLQSQGLTAFLAMPMQTRSGQIGVICCGASTVRYWQDDEVNLLKAIANPLAIALDQAYLYQQSRHAAQLAEHKAQQLTQALHELQQVQAHLIQSEKMSSIGQMVAGIAHEINNPINFIHGNLEYLQESFTSLLDLLRLYQQICPHLTPMLEKALQDFDLEFAQVDIPKSLQSMGMGTDRILEIVLSLRNFSRLDRIELKRVNIHQGLDETLLILQHRLKANADHPKVDVIKEYGHIPPIECYPGQLNQVFMNLLINALDALEEANQLDPTITIHTEAQAETVTITIADNGNGISPEVQAQMFEPLFTTKAIGKGTGFGLSISHQVVTERHQGKLFCRSARGEGTEFVIQLPISQKNTSK
jgi:two-component system, NtrC family, sensor kinase